MPHPSTPHPSTPRRPRGGIRPTAANGTDTATAREVKVLGDSNASGRRPVALDTADFLFHTHLMGPTGVGKSTLIGQLALQDITAQRALVLIEPRGDLARDITARIPEQHRNRLVLLDPDTPGPVPTLNLLDPHDPVSVEHLVAILSSLFRRHWGDRIEEALRIAALTLVSHYHQRARLDPHTRYPHLGDVVRLFTHEALLHRVTAHLHNPTPTSPVTTPDNYLGSDMDGAEYLAGFWRGYAELTPSTREAHTGPLLNRLRSLLLRPFTRQVLTGTGPPIDATTILNQGGILIARLAEASLGADTTALLGSLLVSRIWTAATARTRLPEQQRRPASLYLDEHQTFLHLPTAAETLLTQARALKLGFLLSHQHRAQTTPQLWEAISANAHNKIVFRLSPEDAHNLERHFLPNLSAHDLAHLGPYTAAARLIHNNQHLPAFTFTTRPLPPAPIRRGDGGHR